MKTEFPKKLAKKKLKKVDLVLLAEQMINFFYIPTDYSEASSEQNGIKKILVLARLGFLPIFLPGAIGVFFGFEGFRPTFRGVGVENLAGFFSRF